MWPACGRKCSATAWSAGLIYHRQGEAISAIEGNEALRAWQGHGLVPQWVAGPSADSLAQLRGLRATGEVRSVRLHNTEACRVPFADWIYGEVARLAGGRAHSPVALAGRTLQSPKSWRPWAASRMYRWCSSALTTCIPSPCAPCSGALPQAALELSRFENLGGIEALIGEFGVECFLYGSYYPRLRHGADALLSAPLGH